MYKYYVKKKNKTAALFLSTQLKIFVLTYL